MVPSPPDCPTCTPFMNQIAAAPARQWMSTLHPRGAWFHASRIAIFPKCIAGPEPTSPAPVEADGRPSASTGAGDVGSGPAMHLGKIAILDAWNHAPRGCRVDIHWRAGAAAIWFINGVQVGQSGGLGTIGTDQAIQSVNAD